MRRPATVVRSRRGRVKDADQNSGSSEMRTATRRVELAGTLCSVKLAVDAADASGVSVMDADEIRPTSCWHWRVLLASAHGLAVRLAGMDIAKMTAAVVSGKRATAPMRSGVSRGDRVVLFGTTRRDQRIPGWLSAMEGYRRRRSARPRMAAMAFGRWWAMC